MLTKEQYDQYLVLCKLLSHGDVKMRAIEVFHIYQQLCAEILCEYIPNYYYVEVVGKYIVYVRDTEEHSAKNHAEFILPATYLFDDTWIEKERSRMEQRLKTKVLNILS